jgi:hypothetical protein
VLVIPIDDEAALAWPAAIDGGASLAAAIAEPRLPVDVVRQVARLLRDEPDARPGPGATDAHGRLRRSGSALERAGLGDRPVVDRTITAVGAWIERHGGPPSVPRWPGEARAAVALSHDVDHPDRYGILQAVGRHPERLRRAPQTFFKRAWAEGRARRRDPDPGAFWAFDALIDEEARRGLTSTYLFAAMPFHGPWGTTRDVAYDVRERRFQPVFKRLRATGNGIGLHTGYAAWEAPGRVAAERRRLADAAGVEIAGNRHHYWHLGPEPGVTLREHEAAGLAWDASLAFNEAVGFRRATTLPFNPWDDTLRRPLRVLQLPTACMDGSLLYRMRDVDAAVAVVAGLLDVVADAGGSLVLDWHLQASVPTNPEYRAWAEAYLAILDLVAGRTDLWVTDLDRLARHWTARRALLDPSA